MTPILSNTQRGIVVKGTTDSTIVRGQLVQLVVNPTGLAKVALPTVDGARCDFLVTDDATADDYAAELNPNGSTLYLVSCQPLDSNQSIRVLANGVIAGAAAVMVEANTGKVKAISGTGVWSVGVLEEDATASGQQVLTRPVVWKQ